MESIKSFSERRRVPEDELVINAIRSSGHGGQNVNKVASKIEARWNVDSSMAFTDAEKGKIKKRLANRINSVGDLIVTCEETRSQFNNRVGAIKKLNELVIDALIDDKKRLATSPTKVSEVKRVTEKKAHGQKKQERSHGHFGDGW